MRIDTIRLENFRNYEHLDLKLDPGTNLFYGDNAQGKTNILEAVYVCGTTRSHRSGRDRELIRFGKDEAHIRMEMTRKEVSTRIDMHLKTSRAKGIAVNGVPLRKASELLGMGNYVFFSPEDLNIIKNSPAERRRFMDMELCQLSGVYVHSLADYNRILAQRNKLLHDLKFRPEYEPTLDVWDEQLVRYGQNIIRMREGFVRKLGGILPAIHRRLTGGREELTVCYEKNVQAEEFADQLKKGRERDIRMRTTGNGPHRDDLSFYANTIDVRKYGSQGQQRTAALSLKLSEIELVREETKDVPVLLLDDVLSELDHDRQRFLLEEIRQIQTLITCTGVGNFTENHFRIDRLFHVVNGKVETDHQEDSNV